MTIDGNTQIIAHLGFPTASFKAPMIYNPYFDSIGLNAAVIPMGVRAEDFATSFASIFKMSNICGALITMPHKVTTIGLLDRSSAAVEIAGSCNAVKRAADGALSGDMFDGEGFVRGVLRKGRTILAATVLVIGCGGVGSAIAAAFAAAGAGRISLFDLDAKSMHGLGARIAHHYPKLEIAYGSNDPGGHDIVVNATPLGMNPGDPMPFDMSRLSPKTFVGEVVMKQEVTAFLDAAMAKGCEVQFGIDMLFEQIPAYLEFFGFPTTTPDNLRFLAQVHY